MAETYREMIRRHQKEVDAFPIGAAFTMKQFDEMMKKWGLSPKDDLDKIASIGAGCYIRKADKEEYHALFKRHKQEIKDAISADSTGSGFIKDMFYYELCNHEYCITMDPEDAIYALGITVDEINNDEKLKKGFWLAEAEARKEG